MQAFQTPAFPGQVIAGQSVTVFRSYQLEQRTRLTMLAADASTSGPRSFLHDPFSGYSTRVLDTARALQQGR